jgi:phenylacetate-CoA ligase
MASKISFELFQRAAKNLPAYKQFLKTQDLDPSTIKQSGDFSRVPVTSKKTYLVPNKLEDLVWKENLAGLMLFCSTSGSTGEPYYFPRSEELSEQYSHAVENYLKYSSYGRGRTLVLVGFGMGVWIGGVITQRAFEMAAERSRIPISILPTGYNKTEIFKALKKLAPQFEQTVVIGYPPFVKELVDEAPSEGVDLKKLQVRFFFAAEAFTETFRNYLCEHAGVGSALLDTLNIYGSADVGAMAYETPLSILIRRLAIEDPLLYREMFGQIEKTPTLAQFNPDYIEFEAQDDELLLTADSAMPLIRYAIGDHGGVLSYEHIRTLMSRYKINLDAEVVKAGINKLVNKQHPFVYVYERTDLSVTLHGLIVYPEFIKEALLKPGMSKYFTERFTMATKTDIHHNQFLLINIELQKGVGVTVPIAEKALKAVKKSLIEKSSEFAEVAKSKRADELVKIELWPNGHPRYFAPGTKQKWVEKE